MTEEKNAASLWRIVGASVRGASHGRGGAPNQDAVGWRAGAGGTAFALVAADGHGAPVHARSERGAHLAVSLALAALQPFVDGTTTLGAAATLPERIVTAWRTAVADEIARAPLSEAETRALETHGLDPSGAYGSTLLGMLVTAGAGLAFQLGDGDVFLVPRDGAVVRSFATRELRGEATASLCMPGATQALQTRVFDAPDLAHFDAFAVATDGLGKSFRTDEAAAAQIGSAAHRLAYDSAAAMTPDLEDWLEKVSAAGSGDDISLIIARRTPA